MRDCHIVQAARCFDSTVQSKLDNDFVHSSYPAKLDSKILRSVLEGRMARSVSGHPNHSKIVTKSAFSLSKQH